MKASHINLDLIINTKVAIIINVHVIENKATGLN